VIVEAKQEFYWTRIFSRIWKDKRQLQEFVNINTPVFLFVAPFSTDSVFKTNFTPIGRAIFN
jgi:hypothetical protein